MGYEPKIEGKERAKDQDEGKPGGGADGLGVAEEMVCQRDLLLKKSRAIAEANVHVNSERANDFTRMTSENSQLIAEMNQLRAEKKSFSRRVKELETRLMRAERQGLVARSSSAPDFDSEQRSAKQGGGNMSEARRTAPGGAANTPYLRRKEVDESEVYKRQRQKGINMLPPVSEAGAEGSQVKSLAGKHKGPGPQRRGSGTIEEKRFRQVIGDVDAGDRSMEQQGFHTSKLRDQVETKGGGQSEDDESFAGATRIQQR